MLVTCWIPTSNVSWQIFPTGEVCYGLPWALRFYLLLFHNLMRWCGWLQQNYFKLVNTWVIRLWLSEMAKSQNNTIFAGGSEEMKKFNLLKINIKCESYHSFSTVMYVTQYWELLQEGVTSFNSHPHSMGWYYYPCFTDLEVKVTKDQAPLSNSQI